MALEPVANRQEIIMYLWAIMRVMLIIMVSAIYIWVINLANLMNKEVKIFILAKILAPIA
ncbi:MAG: hypothetical protein EBX37_17015 [Alphaproteobacteria bacterium]|nr:hypothetical protein [Alphaproteobacteria bacterium]